MGQKVSIEIELLDRISGGLDRINSKMDAMKASTSSAKQELANLDGVTDRVKSSLAKLGVAFSMKELVTNIVNVRGQFQQLEVAFQTMLGSATEANSLMSQLVHTAAVTPFGLDDVANGAKQLLAYGLEANKVNETLTRLGDIAAGLSIPLNDLVYLYGTTMAQGRLYTQDLNQFTGRGIPMIKELAKQFGVTEDKVKDLVTAGKVGFPEVQKVIESLTDEGSEFGGLMEAQSKTVTGQISNIEDAFQTMLNEIGKSQEGVINGALGAVSTIIENYDKFGQVLAGVAVVWGTYRTAVMLAAAAEGWASAAEAIHYNWLLLVERAQKLLNATMLSNPYVLVASAAALLVGTTIALWDNTSSLDLANESLNNTLSELQQQQEEYNKQTEEALRLAQDDSAATEDREAAMRLLIARYPQIIQKYIDEEGHLQNILQLKREIAAFDGKQQRNQTTQTLKGEADRTGNLFNEIDALLRQQRSGQPFSAQQKKRLQQIRDAYAKESGKSGTWASLSDIRDFYRAKSGQASTRYNRQVTENKIAEFVGDGGGLSKMSTGQLRSLLKKLRDNNGKNKHRTSVYISELGDYLTYNDRKDLETRVSGMITARSQPTYTPQQNRNRLKRLRDDAKKKLDAFDKSSKKMSPGEYQRRRKALQDDLDQKEKDYKAAGGQSIKSENAAAAKADKAATAQQNKANTAAATAAWKAEVEAQKQERLEEQQKQMKEKLGEELAQLQQQNDAMEIDAMEEGTEKKLRQIANEYERTKNQIDKEEAQWKRENEKAGVKDVGENGLTDEQTKALTQARDIAARRKAAAEAKVREEQLAADVQSMRDYVRDYGSLADQRVAIEEEYNEKIAKADNESEVIRLRAEKRRKLNELTVSEKKGAMGWDGIFEGLGDMTTSQLQGLKQQLKEMLKSGGLDASGYGEVVDKIKSVNEAIVSAQDRERGFLGVVVSYGAERRKLELENADALERQAEASKELAQKKANVATDRFTIYTYMREQGIDVSQDDVKGSNSSALLAKVRKRFDPDSGKDSDKEWYERLKTMLEDLATEEEDAAEATEKKMKADTDAAKSQNALNKFLKNVSERLQDLMPLFEQIDSNLQDLPGLLGEFGVSEDSSLGKAASALADGSSATLSAMKDYMSGNYVGAAMNGLKAVGSYVQSATNLFAGAGNEKKMEAEIARLSESNSELADAIDSLKDQIGDSDNTNRESLDAYRQALAAEKEREENQRTMMLDRASEYTNSGHGFLGMGGKGSFRKYADKNRGAWLADFNEALREHGFTGNLRSAADVLTLSPEAMKVLRDFAPEAWSSFFRSGGYKSPKDLVDDYIEMAGQREEITSSLNEKLTGYSWDSFKDSYDSLLKDLTSDTEDFSDNIEEMISNAFLSSMMNEEFKDRVRAIYDYLAKAAEDGDLSDDELDTIRSMNESLSADMIARRKQAIDAGLIKETNGEKQSGRSGSFSALTQDQGTKLEGLFMNGMQHWSSMDGKLDVVTERMKTAEGHLAKIAENTGVTASELRTIKEKIEVMVRDGVKVQ